MKSRALISVLILIMAVLGITGSCATGKKAVKAPIESVYGNWTNLDYNTEVKNAKCKIKPDGIIEMASHTELEYHHFDDITFTIIESWMHSNGNKYYKVDLVHGIDTWYELWRINETDSVFEYIISNIDYPTKIDPEHMNYRILYRQ